MEKDQLYLNLYTFDENKKKIIKLYFNEIEDDKEIEYSIWKSLMPCIRSIAEENNIQIADNEQASEEGNIILFFLKSKSLANGFFFDALIEERLRPIVHPGKRNENIKIDTLCAPIITICYTDITTLYTEEKREEPSVKKEEKDWNEITYSSFSPDSRVKALDANIWHRFVPIFSPNGNFESNFEDVLKEIIQYYEWGLYYTSAAYVSLEFQMRMLQNSYIAKIGDRGHAEVVTPFKFHSERQMKLKAEKEIKFLKTDWGGGSLLENISWRVLVVDDQARSAISAISEKFQKKNRITKETLIRQPLDRLYKDQKDRDTAKIIQIHAPENPGERNILNFAKERMKEMTYDIIFLDYLLGYKENTSQREYGHEFIKELLQDNRQDISEKAFEQSKEPEISTLIPQYKRDFLGRHWIFPISSFPHAFSDKLIQMGISHLHEIWHISQGGDPISTPHLYAYNLYRFIKQKVGKYFLYPNAMRRAFNEIPFSTDHRDKYWLKILQHVIKNWKEKQDLIKKFNFNKNTSLFAASMKDFLDNQGYLDDIYDSIIKILEILENESENFENDIKEELDKLLNNSPDDYKDILNALKQRILYITEYNKRRALQAIETAINKEETRLSLAGFELKNLPPEIGNASNIEILDLSNNKLSTLPSEFYKLTKLREINLQHNAFQDIPLLRLSFPRLQRVNLSNNQINIFSPELSEKAPSWTYFNISSNPLVYSITKTEATGKNAVEALWNSLKNIDPVKERKDEIRRLLRADELKKAIELLSEMFKSENDLLNEVITIEGELNALEKKMRIGTISSGQESLQLNRIRNRLLKYLD